MGPGVYKTKSFDYKPLNSNDDVEKKLVEQHKEDPRVSILPITNLGKN